MRAAADPAAPIEAARIELYVPVASFRDPMFPGVTRCLPVPPPATVRGMLAAATGQRSELLALGLCAYAEGHGTDDETYHPVAADGSNPAIGGQVQPGKGGRTLRERPFLTEVRVLLWVPTPDADRIAEALRRPVWGLRLGRSQDIAHVRSIRQVTLHPANEAVIGHALAPIGAHDAAQATALRLPDSVSTDRLRTSFADVWWCSQPAGHAPVRGAYQDPTDDQAVWLFTPEDGSAETEELSQVWAKSADRSLLGRPELLTEHSETVRHTARTVATRISSPGVLAAEPCFWSWVETAALLHDAGKVAEGFQRQLRPGGPSWGERHEVLSLAYVDLFTRELPERDRRMVAAAVACHHRCLTGPGQLAEHYPPVARWERKFGRDPDPDPGRPHIQVPKTRHTALASWFARHSGREQSVGERRKLWELARDMFADVHSAWEYPCCAEDGLVAVLLQGALTLADHAGSAHVALHTHMPLPQRFVDRLPQPYPHQESAAETQGHLVLRAPTGSGKTEAGLAWASRQLEDMPGQPRLVWMLPYRASIDAARTRFVNGLDPAPAENAPDIALLHATAAQTLLTQAIADDTAGSHDHCVRSSEADKASDQAKAMRSLFAQRVRVSTPHQLLRAAIAGPRYSSVLLEQANAILVLDELHAYDPTTFGRICAAMRLWEQLGSRVAVLSATLAAPMLALVQETLTQPVTAHRAAEGTAPQRHRLALDESPIIAPDSLRRIRTWLDEGHSVLVVANTVATAQWLYSELAEHATTAHPNDPDAAILLHSRFRGCDRAAIEDRILARYPERTAATSARCGGLVISTQCLEVSLCLDLDRGASEIAPTEALAQRAGRINRRGRHPDGVVEFRVHRAEDDKSHPYELGAVAAAWHALTQAPGPLVSEHTIEEWLRLAYDTDWGRQWLDQARQARDDFTNSFLTFPDPFADRSEHAKGLDEAFDTVEVLWHADLDNYRDARKESVLLAARLFIPIPFGQFKKFHTSGHIRRDESLQVWVAALDYDPTTGLDLTTTSAPVPAMETIL